MLFEGGDGNRHGGLGNIKAAGGGCHVGAVGRGEGVTHLPQGQGGQSDFLMINIHNYYFT